MTDQVWTTRNDRSFKIPSSYWDPLWGFCNGNGDSEVTSAELTECGAKAAAWAGMSDSTQTFLYNFAAKYWNTVDQDGSGSLSYDELRLFCKNSNIYCKYLASGKGYYLERRGRTSCSNGNLIKDGTECRKACDHLKIPKQSILGRNVCYKDAKGYCYQDGWNGAGASMVCTSSSSAAPGSAAPQSDLKIPLPIFWYDEN